MTAGLEVLRLLLDRTLFDTDALLKLSDEVCALALLSFRTVCVVTRLFRPVQRETPVARRATAVLRLLQTLQAGLLSRAALISYKRESASFDCCSIGSRFVVSL